MALIALQPQGSCVTFSSKHVLGSRSLKLKQQLTKHHIVGRTDWHYLLKQNILSIGPPCICGSKSECSRISAFKGSSHYNQKGGRANRLKVPKTSLRVGENGEVTSESPKAQNVPLSYASESNERLASSPAIHKLFKKWLTILRTQPSSQEVEEILGEPPLEVLPETLDETQNKERSKILKTVWTHFLALDATVKIPLLIFVPFYLGVNCKYGPKVSKELTPLWVLGPLIVALYVVIVQKLWMLYAFSFNQTIKVIKNSPSYCILAYRYVFRGKLKEDVRALIVQPILNIKNVDYKKQTRRKLKEWEEWIVEKYLDFVESIWPYYCRIIRFLKRANLI